MCIVKDGDHNKLPVEFITLPNEGVRYLRAQDLRKCEILSNGPIFVKREYFESISRSHIKPGYFLFSIMASIGNIAVVPDNFPNCTANRAVGILIPKSKERLDANYLLALFGSNFGINLLEKLTRGGIQKRINLRDIENLRIPLPPLEIQRAIVAEIEAARQTRKQKLAQADELLSSLDTYLLDQLGLTPPEESYRSTFAISLREARTRFDVDYHTLRFRNLRRMIESNSHSVMSVMDVCKKPLMSGFAAGRQEQAFDDVEGIPHIRPLNITPFGDLSFKGTKYVPLTTISENELLIKDEVLFNNTNSMEWVGKSTVFDGSRESACSNHITRLVLKKEIANSFFIASLFNALRSVGFMGLLSTNFNNQAGINNETLSMLRIPIPSLDEQRLIVSEMSGRRTNAQRLRQEAERNRMGNC